MRCPRSLALASVLTLTSLTRAQDRPKPPAEPIPIDVVLSDLREAYGTLPSAEEVTVRFRSGSGDRSDSFTVRIDPGIPPAPRPRAVLLELGQLRIHIAGGTLTAINAAAPDKVYQRTFTGAITPGRLAELLPPLPLPQLAIINPEDPGLSMPLGLLRDTLWSSATFDEAARPPTLTMTGVGPAGSVSITALVSTVRLTKIAATIRKAGAEAQLDMTFRQVDPGEPASWVISTAGRTMVPSLTDLRTTPKPLGAATPGQPSPNISLSTFNLSGWTLHDAVDAARPKPLAVILFKAPTDPVRAQAAQRDSLVALSVLRSLHSGQPIAGDAPNAPPIPPFVSAAGIIIDLPEFTRDRWSLARKAWSGEAPDPTVGAGELMWSPGSLESIDRFLPGADAVLLVIRADAGRTLSAAIKLDNPQPAALAAEVRKALAP